MSYPDNKNRDWEVIPDVVRKTSSHDGPGLVSYNFFIIII